MPLLLLLLGTQLAFADFENLDQIRFEIAGLSAETCVEALQKISGQIDGLERSDLNPQDLHEHSFAQVSKLFEARQVLRKKIQAFYNQKKYSRECAESMRTTLRKVRGVEDYLANTAVWSGLPVPASSGPIPRGFGPETLVNPDVTDSRQLQSGDLLISRGTAFSSAAIARLGSNDTQFSHLALFYRDEKTGAEFTVEAHIEVGVLVIPFEKYFKDGKVRSAVFRYTGDPAVAHAAAKAMFERVKVPMEAGENIPYDFSMDPDSPGALFCSEVARLGFLLATQDRLQIPLYPSQFKMKNRDFLRRLGADRAESFLPEDIELDPRFVQVAEWRNYRELHQSWRDDAILTAIFSWMEDYGYTFHPGIKNFALKNLAWGIRHTPILRKALEQKLPKNMSASVIGTLIALEDVYQVIIPMVEAEEPLIMRRTGFAPTYFELLAVANRIREEDAARYLQPRSGKSKFHSLLH